jgi:phosphatidate cytidylyltransferase
MTSASPLLVVLLGVAVVLTAATVLGMALAWRFAAHGPSPTIENLNARIASWWGLVAVLGGALVLGRPYVVVLFALISFLGFREFVTLAPTRPGDHWALLAAFFIVLPMQYLFVAIGRSDLYTILVPVCAFLIMPVAAAMQGETKRFLERISELQWGLMICVFCLSHVPALLTLPITGYPERNALLIAFLIIVVQSSDVFQYVWGKLLGHRKIAPKLSPSKTIEGCIGGCASATILGGALWWITPFRPWQATLIAAAIVAMGFLGGLVMSAVKRDRGVKDWGDAISGHGGILDRFDSIIFSAPLFFYFMRACLVN